MRQKRRNRRGRIMISVMCVVLVTIFAVRSIELYNKSQMYKKQLVAVQEEYEFQLKRQEQLQEKEKYVHTKKFAEEYAKEKLGLIYPNEVVFKAS